MKFLFLILVLACSRASIEVPPPTEDVIITLDQDKLPHEAPVPNLPSPTPNPGHVGEGSTYTGPLKPFPSATGYFTTNIKTFNCSDAMKTKIADAGKKIVAIYNSKEFK